MLNGEPVFQSGLLDQGYWPDGIYTAPTDEALAVDLELTRAYGFTMLRKHPKVEPARWYFHADRLGVLVWQDMPNMPIYRPVTPPDEEQFELELFEMLDQFISSPSIVVWAPFNEGWGQYDVDRVNRAVVERDPSRPTIANSGSANCCTAVEPPSTDIRDSHLYPGPWAPLPDHRASVTGEFGVCDDVIPGHTWETDDPADGAPFPDRSNEQDVLDGWNRRQWDALEQQIRWPGLSGSGYTELTDVEHETAGLVTYDREVDKCDRAQLRALNDRLVEVSRDRDARRPQGPALPDGTVARWTFDEGAGTTAADSEGGADLELSDGAAFVADGISGSALDLPGGGARALADAVVDTTGSYTVSAWMRHRDRLQTEPVVSQEGGPDGFGFRLGLFAQDTRTDLFPGYVYEPPPPEQTPPWRWSAEVPGGRADSSYGDLSISPPEGHWEHVVMVVDRDDRTAGLYVDGQHIGTTTDDRDDDARGAFVVGAPTDADPLSGFDGSVDELRVFDRGLSAAEVWQLNRLEDPADPLRRVAGPDRYATAAAASADRFPDGASTVHVATGAAFPDAVAAGPAAGRADGPVLLVQRDRVPEVVAAELRRLDPDRVVLLGGPSAVDAQVEQALAEVAPVERVSGPDRVATAAALSRTTWPDGSSSAYLATSRAFPDALAGGAAAARDDAPVLLTGPDGLAPAARDELVRLGVRRVVVLGGPAAVDEQVLDDVRSVTGADVARVFGADRYATAAEVAETFAAADEAVVATGEAFPDALAGVASAAAVDGPVLLVRRDDLPAAIMPPLRRLAPPRTVLLGGTAAVTDGHEQALRGALLTVNGAGPG